MGRGRGHRTGGVATTAQAAVPAVRNTTQEAPYDEGRLARLVEALDEVRGAKEGSSRSFWMSSLGRRDHLEEHCLEALKEALEAGDYAAAREIGAEFHRRLESPAEALEALRAADEQAEAAADLVVMLPYMEHLVETGTGDRFCEEQVAEISALFVHSWFERSSDIRELLRAWAKDLESEVLAWDADQDPQDQTFDRLEDALRATRAAILASGLVGPVESGAFVKPAAFNRFVHEQARSAGTPDVQVGLADGRVAAVARAEVRVSGQPLRLLVCCEVGHLTPAQPSWEAYGYVRGFADAHGLKLDEESLLGLPGGVVSSWAGYERRANLRAVREKDIFGTQACDHLESEWELIGDEAVLRCQSCFNPVAARVPAHRVPEDHPVLEHLDVEIYPSQRRFWNAVRGLPREILSSFGAMARRDGTVSMDPADHATPEAEPRTSGHRSVAAAMNRR